MESMNSGRRISATGTAVNGRTWSWAQVDSTHITSRSTRRSRRADTPSPNDSAKRRSRSGPSPSGRSQTSHHAFSPSGGGPSDCHRSSKIVERMRAVLAISSLLRGLPVADSLARKSSKSCRNFARYSSLTHTVARSGVPAS